MVPFEEKIESLMFDRETVLNEGTFGFKGGSSKDVLLMVGNAFRR